MPLALSIYSWTGVFISSEQVNPLSVGNSLPSHDLLRNRAETDDWLCKTYFSAIEDFDGSEDPT